uniref:PPM-type phosphatase domain-containing protein n=1 Tax=Aplanochytrium stocchinoi TaxID=215587 RepID=A0A7S3LPP9_9STRA
MSKLIFKFEEYGACHATLGCLGDRDSMEDSAATAKNFEPYMNEPTIYGVYDGHGGAQCAHYCRDHMAEAVASHPKINTDPKKAIFDAFLHLDDKYCELSSKYNLDDGATATLLYVCLDHAQSKKRKERIRYFCAAVGDSRAILVKKDGTTIALSKDHSPERPDEYERIKRQGGQIQFDKDNEGGRVVSEKVGMLAVTRSIGDVDFKPYVTAEPEISEGFLDKDVAYIVLASDGLWGQVENKEVGNYLVKEKAKLATKIEGLIMVAKERDNDLSKRHHEPLMCDNVTVTVIKVSSLLEKMLKAQDAKDKEREVAQRRKKQEEENKEADKMTLQIPGLDPKGYTAELLLWRSPLRSGLWLLVGCLLFFLTSFVGYSVLTIGSYLLIAQLMINSIVVNFSPLLKQARLVNKDFDTTVFISEGTFFTSELTDRAAEMTLQVCYIVR